MKKVLAVLILSVALIGVSFSAQPYLFSVYDTTANVNAFHSLSMDSVGVLLSIDNVSPLADYAGTAGVSSTLKGYVGSTVAQSLSTLVFAVGTVQNYIDSLGTVITHSATFTFKPTITFGIIANAGNSSTHFMVPEQITPTTSVCTVGVYKMTIAGAVPVYSECTAGEVGLTWQAIGK